MVPDSEEGCASGKSSSGVWGEQLCSLSEGDGSGYPEEELLGVAPFHESGQELG